jgi:hypothetical protein
MQNLDFQGSQMDLDDLVDRDFPGGSPCIQKHCTDKQHMDKVEELKSENMQKRNKRHRPHEEVGVEPKQQKM